VRSRLLGGLKTIEASFEKIKAGTGKLMNVVVERNCASEHSRMKTERRIAIRSKAFLLATSSRLQSQYSIFSAHAVLALMGTLLDLFNVVERLRESDTQNPEWGQQSQSFQRPSSRNMSSDYEPPPRELDL